jgi:hypothetical protein
MQLCFLGSSHAELIQAELSVCFITHHEPLAGCGVRPRCPGLTLEALTADSHMQPFVCPQLSGSTMCSNEKESLLLSEHGAPVVGLVTVCHCDEVSGKITYGQAGKVCVSS